MVVDSELIAARDQANSAWAAVEAAQQATWAAWAGAIANLLVVIVTVVLAVRAAREATRIQQSAETSANWATMARGEEFLATIMTLFRGVIDSLPGETVQRVQILASLQAAEIPLRYALENRVPDQRLHILVMRLQSLFTSMKTTLEHVMPNGPSDCKALGDLLIGFRDMFLELGTELRTIEELHGYQRWKVAPAPGQTGEGRGLGEQV